MSQVIATFGASTVTLAALVLVLMVLAHLSLRWWIKHKARQDDDAVGAAAAGDARLRRWITRGLREILPALVLLDFSLLELDQRMRIARVPEPVQPWVLVFALLGLGRIVRGRGHSTPP